MFTPRRFYIYTVAAISLQSVTWAIISLLRNLVISNLDPERTALAFQTAIILIGLPVFVIHWLWGQRLSVQEVEERGAVLRRLYLYGMQSAFLGPFIHAAFGVVSSLMYLPVDEKPRGFYPPLSPAESIIYYLITMLVVGTLWYYHQWIKDEDAKVVPEREEAATVRRLYILGFSAVGLSMTTIAAIAILRWLLLQIGDGGTGAISRGAGPLYELSRMIIGLPLWFLFWRWAQSLFHEGIVEERESVLRKSYLYTIVFISALTVVTSATFILEGLLRRLLDFRSLSTSGDDIRIPISIIVGMAIAWGYHASIIRTDAKLVREAPRQAGLRRLYLYLIAGIGLAVLLIGVSGDFNVLIQSLDQAAFGTSLKRQLAWFTALIIAGLPVWLLPWRQAQAQSTISGIEGAGERRSLVRKIYLYFFLLIATLTMLSSVIYIVFRILNMVLGGPSLTIITLGQPIAYSLIAVGVLLYHGSILRKDRQLFLQDQAARHEGLKIVFLDVVEEGYLQVAADEIRREIPGISIVHFNLTEVPSEPSDELKEKELLTQLTESSIIIGPSMITAPGGAGGVVTTAIAQSVVSSSAKKLMIPYWTESWNWAGVDRLNRDASVRQIVHAIKQLLEGEVVRPHKPLSVGAIIGIIVGALIVLFLISIPLFYFLI